MTLIVSTDPSTTDRLHSLLERYSPLLMAKSREEAFDLAKQHPVKLAIVNFEDPPEAYDILHTLLDLRKDIEVVLVSSPEQGKAIMPLVQAGLAMYVEKPLDPEQLKSKIAPILGLSLRQAEQATDRLVPSSPQEAPVKMDPVSMDRLIMDLAHRLKNPLVSIRTFAHLFKERANDTQFQKDFYETMRQEVERIDDLIDQLIEFSELPDPFVALHPILPIVEEAVKKANNQLRRIDIHLEQNLSGPSPILLMDKDQLIYALTHLLAGLGSCLPKPAHAKTPKTQISVRLQSATDTGGVEVLIESNASLFQDRTQFLGLELFIAKRIIERQQGVVRWEISPQGQASVRILFHGNRPVVSDQKLDSWKQTVPAYAERRKKQLVIAFRDRRSRQRRLYTRSTYFPDRRRTVPATAQ